ncbi:MAG: PilZ domain-containing protein [Candidatus Omnitrophica bacterium]|nr:PilZ domain-containing protein [Candidatus Omnitrophota bacterium]
MKKDYNFKDRRKFIRHPLTFPLRYNILSDTKGVLLGKREAKSTTINISIGGLLFSSRHALDKGVLIDLKMPFGDKVFKVKARVVHCVKNIDTKFFNVGVSFHRLRDAFKVKLIEQLYLISEYRDLRSVQLGREVTLEEASKDWIKRYSERFRRLYW